MTRFILINFSIILLHEFSRQIFSQCLYESLISDLLSLDVSVEIGVAVLGTTEKVTDLLEEAWLVVNDGEASETWLTRIGEQCVSMLFCTTIANEKDYMPLMLLPRS